jgi:hypothetical protein
MKKNKTDQQLALKLEQKTAKIEKDYRSKRQRRNKNKKNQEELSQQWLAPLLLIITLAIGYLLYYFY